MNAALLQNTLCLVLSLTWNMQTKNTLSKLFTIICVFSRYQELNHRSLYETKNSSCGDPRPCLAVTRCQQLNLFFFSYNSLYEIFTITCKERLSFVKSRCDHDALVHHANEFIFVLATGLEGSGRRSLWQVC